MFNVDHLRLYLPYHISLLTGFDMHKIFPCLFEAFGFLCYLTCLNLNLKSHFMLGSEVFILNVIFLSIYF
jgi:hypothetical protein